MPDKILLCAYKCAESLQSFLQEGFGLSRALIKKHRLPKNYLSKKIEVGALLELPITLLNHGRILSYREQRIEVIQESEDFLIIHKPHNTHSHPLGYDEWNNLLSALFFHYPRLEQINQGFYDRGLLYRLDFETSGIMVYVKSEGRLKRLRDNFQELVKEKQYIAIVEGSFPTTLELKNNISRSGKTIKLDPKGARANIKVSNIQSKDGLSLVKIQLKEGLRHQIRVQLAHAKFPILGDELYGGRPSQRVFLHCLRYHIEDKEFEDLSCPLFSDFFDLNGKL